MRRCRVWLAVIAALVWLSASPRGQTAGVPEAEYAAAVRTYVEGHDAAKAATPIAAWPHDRFKIAVAKYLTQPEALLAAAAAFHLEIGIGVVILSPVLAGRHLDFGHQLVGQLRTPVRLGPGLSPEDASAFAERWYTAAASTFLMVNDSSRAGPFISRGLEVAPRSLDLRLMSGIVDDLSGLSLDPVEAVTSAQRLRFESSRTMAFRRAKEKFARILVDAPLFTRARVRLGRVLWMLDEGDAAMVELLRAQAEAREPAQRYLASMFLGAIYERTGNVAGARAAYEAARAAAPASQAATVALGYLDVMAGRPDRAKALARTLLSAPPVADEWWSYKNGGFETAALAWLRHRVWQ